MTPAIEMLSETNRNEVDAYLVRHEDSAQFLINNLREHGPRLTSHHNSGNFKAIRSDGQISAVFCLARRGDLIIQADHDFSQTILSACEKETLPLKGFIGDWASVAPVWERFKKANPTFKPSYESKEILYAYLLSGTNSKLRRDERVRFLENSDFDQWLAFGVSYLSELGLPDDTTTEQKRDTFAQMVLNRLWWGLFSGKIMLSRTALNSKGTSVGQVGGVFTPKQHRQKGYARATTFHMLKDCRDLHGHTKNILFTGETDLPAQKLYESMGYKRVGSFAVILG